MHLDTTGEDDAYTGVVAAYWWVAGLALTDGETVALRVERRERPEEPQFAHVTTPEVLVKNTGKASTTLGNPLSTTFPKSAQAFQTGTTTGGYTLTSIGIDFLSIADTATVGAELTVTLNGTTTDSSHNVIPGSVLCTLDDPASFTTNAVNTFTAPTSGTLCPRLTRGRTYFVVLDRSSGTTTLSMDATDDNDEDSGGDTTWSIRDADHFFTSSAWAASSQTSLMIEVKGNTSSHPATGAPTITGTLRVGEELTAGTSAIMDEEGLNNPGYTYQWIRNDGTDDSDISRATSGTYTLVSDDAGHTIKVRVSFTDDAGFEESLTSTATAMIDDPTLLVKNTGQAI